MSTRILVINDTQDILEMFRLILEDAGYEAILSSFPFQKVSEIEQIKPDLIILDFVFGDQKTGWQMLQLLKMQRSTASIPVIICTAAIQAMREVEGSLVAKGVLVVYKPFDLDELLTTISQLLQTHKNVLSQFEDETNKKD